MFAEHRQNGYLKIVGAMGDVKKQEGKMARGTRGRYMTQKMMKGANRLVELCIQSMSPNVVADVTARARILPESIDWTFCDNWFIGYREEGLDKLTNAVKRPDDWGVGCEIESEYGRRFWTHEGMLGRLRGLSACQAFAQGSLVDRLELFIISEVNIAFLDFRKVFQYIYGVNDIELYSALKELIRRADIAIASVHNCDEYAVGPFTLHAAACSKEACMGCYLDESGKPLARGTWYDVMSMKALQLDGLLMHMFAGCLDNLRDDRECQIVPFNVLKQCYEVKNGPLDNCCGYLHELMMIKTRNIIADDYDVTQGEFEKRLRFVQSLDNSMHLHIRRIQKAAHSGSDPDEYMYIMNTPNIIPVCDETADESDIEKAIQLLEKNMDSLRRDKKTGKVINAEKVRFVFNEIPKVFSLKSLYEIFERFDTEAEVVRRDVRSLCKKGQIIAIERGMYCSKEYADDHFVRIGRNPSEEETILESCVNTAMKNLATAMDLLSKSLSNLTGNNECMTDDNGCLEDDGES
ncbi:MAG: hypothetical protein J6A01_09085 [Proteobacteria bacterium]|nr:hypothetical protein [Pseudomonadota bacterium]